MKSALITFGNEESYGLSFVGGELLGHKQEIHFFDGDNGNWLKVKEWKPDFLMFSPLTTFFPKALQLARRLKRATKATVVFGGHHAFASPEIIKDYAIDAVVIGPVNGSIEKILDGERGIIRTEPTTPADLPKPARKQYYKDIPRAGKRYRKFLLSMLGCPWNCSYCSSSSGHISSVFGRQIHKDYFLAHRPIPDVISEAKDIMENTHEIEWVDDDIFAGDENWLLEFIGEWIRNFSYTIIDPYGPAQENTLPMYVSTTSISALKVSDTLLRSLKRCVNVVGMGIQAIRPESLKLFNRPWDNEKKMKAAYDRLISFGYRVNLQCIVGLPVNDPVEDALETVLAMQRIGAGSICSCYPLMIYPGTKLSEMDLPLNEDCSGDTNNAVCGIKFSDDIQKQLRNICKLATFFVKYNIAERWMRALIGMDFNEEISEQLSMLRYRECVVDQLGNKGERIFNEILSTMKLRY